MQNLSQYPVVRRLGSAAFRFSTLAALAAVLALAWLAPGLGIKYWTSTLTVIQRSAYTLQCGQLVFLVLFSAYFRLPWRSRNFGIVLGLGILSSTGVAINAIISQIGPTAFREHRYQFWLAYECTTILAIVVWLSYLLAREHTPAPPSSTLPKHDLDTWNQELERLLEP
jgi:hypothetical protein